MATSGSNSAHEQSQVWQIWEYETNSLRTLKKSHPAIVRRRSILVPRAYNSSGLWALDPNHSPEGSSALGTRMAEIEQASEGARIFFALPPSFDPFAKIGDLASSKFSGVGILLESTRTIFKMAALKVKHPSQSPSTQARNVL